MLALQFYAGRNLITFRSTWTVLCWIYERFHRYHSCRCRCLHPVRMRDHLNVYLGKDPYHGRGHPNIPRDVWTFRSLAPFSCLKSFQCISWPSFWLYSFCLSLRLFHASGDSTSRYQAPDTIERQQDAGQLRCITNGSPPPRSSSSSS